MKVLLRVLFGSFDTQLQGCLICEENANIVQFAFYVSMQFTVTKQRLQINYFVKMSSFGVELGNQEKHWVSQIICKICGETLWQGQMAHGQQEIIQLHISS